jgi:hypothetical protein
LQTFLPNLAFSLLIISFAVQSLMLLHLSICCFRCLWFRGLIYAKIIAQSTIVELSPLCFLLKDL